MLCTNAYACTPSTRRFSLNAQIEETQGAAQRTASMPRGLAAAFIVFAFIVCFSGEQQQGFFLQQQLCAAAATKTTIAAATATIDQKQSNGAIARTASAQRAKEPEQLLGELLVAYMPLARLCFGTKQSSFSLTSAYVSNLDKLQALWAAMKLRQELR